MTKPLSRLLTIGIMIVSLNVIAVDTSGQSKLISDRNNRGYNHTEEENKKNEKILQLPELIVKSHRKEVLHIVAYIRENSYMSNYGDTVRLFREKWVDFMIPMRDARNFKGWNKPRLLTSKSYYHFFNYNGLDSVSNEYNHYFSYSDWIEIPNSIKVPGNNDSKAFYIQTAPNKKDVSRLWEKNDDNISVTMDLMSDASNWEYAPEIHTGFQDVVEFDKFQINYTYNNVVDRTLYATDLNSAVYELESYGRGYEKYQNSIFQVPAFVSSKIEVYFIDKEFLSKKEAGKWRDIRNKLDKIDILTLNDEVPEPDISAQNLIARVNETDFAKRKTFVKPEQRLAGIDLSEKSKKVKKRRLKTILNSFLNK